MTILKNMKSSFVNESMGVGMTSHDLTEASGFMGFILIFLDMS